MSFEVKVDVKMANYRDLIHQAAEECANVIRDRSRMDVASVGRRFADKLTVPVKRISGGYVIQVIQRPAYSKVFEFGGVSRGKPMLWIPVSGRGRARTFRGGLFRPKGANILVGTRDHKVKFIGVASIVNRRRLHLHEIAQEEAAKLVQHMGPALRKGG
jgi:hypothetical protein